MRRRSNFAATAMSLLLVAFLAGDALGQTAKQPFVGSWTIVSADTVRPDGTRVPNFGSGPKGFLVFDGSGRYALQIMSANRAKFASNNRLEGTPEENKSVVQGMIAYFGRYSVNEADRTFTFQVENSSFPNWEGTAQKRPFTITADQLKYSVAAASGGGSGEVVWKRVK